MIQRTSLRVFPRGREERDSKCEFTRYDFRGLDLHEALHGEGVPEELAHSRLQAEDGLAGGRLRGENTHTHRAALQNTCRDSLDSLHDRNRCENARLPTPAHARLLYGTAEACVHARRPPPDLYNYHALEMEAVTPS